MRGLREIQCAHSFSRDILLHASSWLWRILIVHFQCLCLTYDSCIKVLLIQLTYMFLFLHGASQASVRLASLPWKSLQIRLHPEEVLWTAPALLRLDPYRTHQKMTEKVGRTRRQMEIQSDSGALYFLLLFFLLCNSPSLMFWSFSSRLPCRTDPYSTCHGTKRSNPHDQCSQFLCHVHLFSLSVRPAVHVSLNVFLHTTLVVPFLVEFFSSSSFLFHVKLRSLLPNFLCHCFSCFFSVFSS